VYRCNLAGNSVQVFTSQYFFRDKLRVSVFETATHLHLRGGWGGVVFFFKENFMN